MKFSEGLFSKESILILFSLVLISFLTVSAQEAYADIIFNDPFDVDPAANGWTEKIVKVPVGNLPVTATGDISSNGEGQVVLEKTGKASALELSITRTIDTTDFENIKLGLTAKQSPGNYESEDFIRIEYNSGSGFVTLLEDHEVWMGEGKPKSDGNTVFTPSGDLPLPATASNIASLMVRLTVFIDAVNEDIFFDDFVVKGKIISTLPTEQEEVIEYVIDQLTSLINTNKGTPLADKVDDARVSTQTALEEIKKSPPDNQAAAGNIEGAIGSLEDAIKDNGLDPTQGKQLINQLLEVSRQIAVNAIETYSIAPSINQDKSKSFSIILIEIKG